MWGALWEKPPRGVVTDSEGTIAPKWTNREAMAIIYAMRRAVVLQRLFPLWYQFAAVAYGWDPTDASKMALDASAKRADQIYDADAAVQLQLELQRITGELDDRKSTMSPDLRLDAGAFVDPLVVSDVMAALAADGADVQFKVPLPACKDPKTGKPVGRPTRNKQTGKWECAPVLVDDPATAISKSLTKVVIPLGLLWLAWKALNKETRRDRRRR